MYIHKILILSKFTVLFLWICLFLYILQIFDMSPNFYDTYYIVL